MKYSSSPLVAILFAILPLAALADMGPLAKFLPNDGSDGAWTAVNRNGTLSLSNTADPGALTYFYTDADAGPDSRRRISVDVTMRPAGDSALAGILYAFDPKTRSYFLFVLQLGHKVSLIRRDANGFKPMIESRSPSVTDGTNTLVIDETAEGITLLVNGDQVAEIGTSGIGRGGVGIIAGGTVEATFANFSLGQQKAGLTPRSRHEGLVPAKSGAPATKTAAGSYDTAPLRLRPVQILDSTGPFGPAVAYRTLLPDGWKAEGGVVWPSAGSCVSGPQLQWSAESADGGWSVAFLPLTSWGVSSDGIPFGCLNQDLADAEAVARVYARSLPDLKLTDLRFERLPDMAPFVQQLSAGLVQLSGMRGWTDGGVLSATLTDPKGGRHDAGIFLVTQHIEMDNSQLSGVPGGARFGSTGLVIAMSAPPGHGDDESPEIIAILQNLKVDPHWNQAVQKWREAQRPKKSGTGKSVAEINSSILDDSMASFQRRGAMSDAGQSASVRGIWETQRYADTSGNPIELDMHYKHAWELDDGSVVQTDDALFNPMQTFGEAGTELEPMK